MNCITQYTLTAHRLLFETHSMHVLYLFHFYIYLRVPEIVSGTNEELYSLFENHDYKQMVQIMS